MTGRLVNTIAVKLCLWKCNGRPPVTHLVQAVAKCLAKKPSRNEGEAFAPSGFLGALTYILKARCAWRIIYLHDRPLSAKSGHLPDVELRAFAKPKRAIFDSSSSSGWLSRQIAHDCFKSINPVRLHIQGKGTILTC